MSTAPLTSSAPPADNVVREDEVDERLFVASVEKAMRVLESFDRDNQALSILEINERTQLGRSATQRFVYTLHQLGYLQRLAGAKTYRLSSRLVGLAGAMLGGNAPLQHAWPYLVELARETGESISWVELDGDEIIVLGNIPSVHPVSVNLPVGSRYAALPASSGQVLLAHLPDTSLRTRIAGMPSNVRDRFGDRDDDEILSFFTRARAQGYSMTEKNLGQGSVSISVPVVDARGQTIAALNLSTLATRHDAQAARTRLLPLVTKAARELIAA
ncbi:IclR family transcriptional regulator [Achromobacter sp. ACRQX]|uniref:IclR family transcriptional regulator n=1 Tax=Achromobacter sp. ACRQX TaxID=2918181 RepID=UPI001EF16323|nr:IclR family transcriptional regulator C-terminal domain-containing protein [Achromobacter sp. ACRQX]MCG7324139.1 helix-turn-helix domain-containing protein [Achromobacter sp. ACRQX]